MKEGRIKEAISKRKPLKEGRIEENKCRTKRLLLFGEVGEIDCREDAFGSADRKTVFVFRIRKRREKSLFLSVAIVRDCLFKQSEIIFFSKRRTERG